MKVTLTGSLGHTGKPLAEKMVKAGHQVKVITSSDDKRGAIEAIGATAAVGSVSDEAFLKNAFSGADAVYAMVPPDFGVDDYVGYYDSVGRNYAQAITAAGVKTVISLSSVGADQPHGTGPIAGLYKMEQSLDALDGVSVKHLRAGFFFTNFYNDVSLIKNMQIMGGNYGGDEQLIMVHPADIADAAVEELQRGFSGKSVRYVSSDKRSTNEVASILGAAVGKPDLKWVQFSDQQALEGMEKAGFPRSIAETFVEMGAAIRNGILWEDYNKQNATPSGKTKLEDFAKEFAGKF